MTTKKTCSVPSCEGSVMARGWCWKHYNRWREHGDPEKVLRRVDKRPWPQRLMSSFVTTPGGCWEWTKALATNGYSKFFRDGRTLSGHRAMYELWVGPIPDGLHLDHLCVNRKCVNPAHLEPVTPKVNSERALRLLCPQGHVKDGVWAFNGYRYCSTCRTAHRKRYEQQKRRAS